MDTQEQNSTMNAAVRELIDASKPLLVDDVFEVCEVREGLIEQCAHCGAQAMSDVGIEHHEGCRAERLRKAIAAVEKEKSNAVDS